MALMCVQPHTIARSQCCVSDCTKLEMRHWWACSGVMFLQSFLKFVEQVKRLKWVTHTKFANLRCMLAIEKTVGLKWLLKK